MALDPRLAQELVQTVDTRFDQLAKQRPYSAYGTVAAVDLVNLKASVYVSGDTAASTGFVFARGDTPTVGDRVRVVVDPRGDRYIDRVYGSILKVAPQDNVNEGGEILLAGAAAYPDWKIDNYQGRVRMHGTSGVFFNLSVNGWQALPLQNGWVAYGGGGMYGAANGYFKDALGFVHLRGLIAGGTVTVGTIMLTLPAGSRPADRTIFLVLSNDVPIRLDLTTGGELIQMSGSASNLWISLTGITFYAGGL